MAKEASGAGPSVSVPRWVSDEFALETRMMWQVLRASPASSALFWFGLSLLLVIGLTAYGQIELNAWNKPFYDAISSRDLEGFIHQLWVFGYLAGALLALNVTQTWLNQMTRMTLREALTRDLVAQWLSPKRAFMVAGAGEMGVNPDQRIQEDVRHLADVTTDLGVGLLQAAVLLASFIGVLWSLSAGMTFHLAGKSLAIPGYMVWCALFYAGAASLASWRVGRPLIGLNAEHYAREADLRFALMHVNEQREGIAVYRGEAEEKDRLNDSFGRLLVVLRQLVRATTNLTWVTAGYGWFTILAPILVASPAYFAGDLSLGGLLMSAGAFTQVQQSLRWFVDNAGAIADWRATQHRVGGFRRALLDVDKIGKEASRIEINAATGDKLIIDNLCVFLGSGCLRLNEPHIEIGPGERVLIIGAPGSGKTSLFRALAGLWPWGSGKINLPYKPSAKTLDQTAADGARVTFMPKRPFIPEGALCDVLAYPAPADKFTWQDFDAVLTRVGLSHLSPRLDRRARWDQQLTDPEQQGLAFARLLLHKPRCVIIDEAIEALAPQTRQAVFDVFANELAATTLVYIDGPQAAGENFTRILQICFNPQGQKLACASDRSA